MSRVHATCEACGRRIAAASVGAIPHDCPACGAVLDGTLPGDVPAEPLGRIGKYRVLERIGAGGMGEVFRGEHPELGHSVAIKLIRDDRVAPARRQEMLGRFRREGRASARIDHPGVVRVHDLGDDPRGLYLVMDYVEGTSLERRLEDGPLAPTHALKIAYQLARTLQAVHAAGVVHRDIKPANVLIDQRGQPRLLDFGISHLEDADEQLTTDGQVIGTPAYMSPEQVEANPGEIDARSDVYSLGVMLYQMLTGVSPFAGGRMMDVARRVLTVDPDPPSTVRPGLSPGIDRLLERAMAKSPGDRPAGAAELAGELARLLRRAGPPSAAAPRPAESPRTRPSIGRVAGGAAATLLLLILGLWSWPRSGDAPTTDPRSAHRPTPPATDPEPPPATDPEPPPATDPEPPPATDPKPPPATDPKPPPATDPKPPPATDPKPPPATDPKPPPATDPKPPPATDPKPPPATDPEPPPATDPRPPPAIDPKPPPATDPKPPPATDPPRAPTAAERRAIQTVRGLTAHARGRPTQRLAQLHDAIAALSADQTEVLYWRGVALTHAGAFGQAHAALRAAAERGHAAAVWRQRVAWVYARGLWLNFWAAPPWLRLDLDRPELAWPVAPPADLEAAQKRLIDGCVALTAGDPEAAIQALQPLATAARSELTLDGLILLACAYEMRYDDGDHVRARKTLAAAGRISTRYPALHLAAVLQTDDEATHRTLAELRRWVSPRTPEHHLARLLEAAEECDLALLDRVLEQIDAIDPDGPARAWGPPMLLWSGTLPGPRSGVEVVLVGELLKRLRVSDACAARHPSAGVSRVVLSLLSHDPGLTGALDRLSGPALGGGLRLGDWRAARRAGAPLRHGLRGHVLDALYQLEPARKALVQFLAAGDSPVEARWRAHTLLARIALVDAPASASARRAARPHVAAAIELGSDPAAYPVSIRPASYDEGLKPALAAIALELAAEWHRTSRARALVLRALTHARHFGISWTQLRRDSRFRSLRRLEEFTDLAED